MDQSTHDIRRANWLNIVNQCQAKPDNISVKQWLADNGIKEKAYYYWLRKFRKEEYTQMQVPATVQTAEVSFAEIPVPVEAKPSSTSTGLCKTIAPVAIIKGNGLTIELSNDISDSLLSRLLLEVTHA